MKRRSSVLFDVVYGVLRLTAVDAVNGVRKHANVGNGRKILALHDVRTSCNARFLDRHGVRVAFSLRPSTACSGRRRP